MQADCDCFNLKKVYSFKYLGCIIDRNLNFDLHIKSIHKLINKLKNALHICTSKNSKQSVLSAFVDSYINYSMTIWGENDTKNLLRLQKKITQKYKIKDV